MPQYSPPSRNYPQELPDYWRFENGTVHTDLQTLTNTELKKLGWHGPITMPEDIVGTSRFTHNYIWNPNKLEFDAIEVDEYETQKRVDYNQFWNLLMGGGIKTKNEDEFRGVESIEIKGIVYQKIRNSAKISLEVNVIVTEFLSLIFEAKTGNANVEKIQQILLEILSTISFTDEELLEIQYIFEETGMSYVYKLN
jgi:hypothetical protein